MKLSDFWWQLLLLALTCYLIGSISFATLLAKLFKKKNIREEGSKNPGTMNMLRTHGAKMGILTLLLDVLKGALPCLFAQRIFSGLSENAPALLLGDIALYLAGLSVIVGHIYPVFYRFKGGKGAASTLGVFFWANPVGMSIVFVLAFIYLLLFEYGSVASFICIVTLIVERGIHYNADPHFVASGGNLLLSLLLFGLAFVTMFAHRQNIVRLITGTEHKTSLKKIFKIKEKEEKY